MSAAFTARAPGRVNLIGEHTDYNGGWVLPAALSVGIEVTLAPRSDNSVAVSSLNRIKIVKKKTNKFKRFHSDRYDRVKVTEDSLIAELEKAPWY